MSRKSRPVKKITVDPAFAPPIGADDYIKFSNESLVYKSESEETFEEEVLEELITEDADGGGGLTPPTSFTVVSQTFRRTASGQMVVDLIIMVDDVQGATEYEIRSTT